MISTRTNRPITGITPNPIFWCGICGLKLKNAYMALQHMRGRVHNAKINTKTSTTNQGNQKTTIDLCSSDQVRPATKVSISMKEKQSGQGAVFDRKCDVCNLVFDSSIIALQHFQGKKHVAATKTYLSTINSKKIPVHQSNVKICNINKAKQVGLTVQDFLFKSPIQPAKISISDESQKHADHNLNSTTMAMQQNKGKEKTTVQSDEAKSKNNVINPSNQNNVIKDKHLLDQKKEGHDVQESPNNQRKKASDPNLTCEACNVEFNSLTMAIQHYKGKKHAQTILSNKNEAIRVPKRKSLPDTSEVEKPTAPTVGDTPAKKSKDDEESSTKVVSDDKLKKCDGCNILFTCELSAKQHYAGKKHARTVAAKKAATENEIMMRWQGRDDTGVSTRGSDRGRGRGNTRVNGNMSIREQYRNILLGHKEVSSDDLLRKAVLPSKLRILMDAAAASNNNNKNIVHDPLKQKHFQLQHEQCQPRQYTSSQNAVYGSRVQPAAHNDYCNDRTPLPASKGSINVDRGRQYYTNDYVSNGYYNSNGGYGSNDIGNQTSNEHVTGRYL